MGVTFRTCTACGNTYCDAGPDFSCNEDMGGCGSGYCSTGCAKLIRHGHDTLLTWAEREKLSNEELNAITLTCVDCRGELANDSNLLAFMLERAGMTRDAAKAAYLAQKGNRS